MGLLLKQLKNLINKHSTYFTLLRTKNGSNEDYFFCRFMAVCYYAEGVAVCLLLFAASVTTQEDQEDYFLDVSRTNIS